MSLHALRKGLGKALSFLRALTGDSAYDDYRGRTLARGALPLSRSEFYLDAVRRKYSGPNRCC